MKMNLKLALVLVTAMVALGASAVQRDTNATTTASAYTPKAPGDALSGFDSNAPALWMATANTNRTVGTNDWNRIPFAGATTNFTFLKATGVTGTLWIVNGVITNKP